VSLPIENRESALTIFDAFHIHRQEILDDFWDESEFQDLQATSTIESWSDSTHLLRRLWRHLPFGRHLGPSDYNDLINTLSVVVEDAREQLYYCYVPCLILVLCAHLCFPFIVSFLICTYRTALPLIPD
jgi:hypothetical protein